MTRRSRVAINIVYGDQEIGRITSKELIKNVNRILQRVYRAGLRKGKKLSKKDAPVVDWNDFELMGR
jgi:hypothetical protein